MKGIIFDYENNYLMASIFLSRGSV